MIKCHWTPGLGCIICERIAGNSSVKPGYIKVVISTGDYYEKTRRDENWSDQHWHDGFLTYIVSNYSVYFKFVPVKVCYCYCRH